MEKLYSVMSTSSKSITLDDFLSKSLGVILANLTPHSKIKLIRIIKINIKVF